MRYLKNKKSTLLHCSHCGKNFSARSRSAQYCARHTAGSVQLEQRAVHGGVRIVPELISFDDLRDKFLPPGSRSRATHYGNWVGISKARGLAPSCYSSVTLDGWIRKISATSTTNFEVISPSWSFALLGKVDQAGEKLAWIFTVGPSF